ncbi:MAG: ATP-binding cassette domain-containing protein [Candidatus Obscuribacterales bacterium]|nr:ATP-binding cassette domain-containing protein [Candidatus Obscuribacterales bacterium]
MKAVTLNHIRKTFTVSKGRWFKRERLEYPAVQGISLHVEQGESVAFIGPNGAGKSTTIKMLTGILRPTSGTAQVLGLTPWQDRAALTCKIAAVFGQRSQLWYHLPPIDSFDLLACIYDLGAVEYKKRKDMLIERFGLGDVLHIPVRKLSLGQRMRAEIAASLLHKPQVLFLDEPTIGLDVVARRELRDLLRQWNREDGMTIFLTSHDAGDIESVADRVVVVNHGRIVLDDSVESVCSKFLSRKILNVLFHQSPAAFQLPGVKSLSGSKYGLHLEIDTDVIGIDQVLQKVMTLGVVADLTIEDPPLEDVIAHIYGLKPHAPSLSGDQIDHPNLSAPAAC